MQKYFHFTITCDARRQIPKMILERLVDEYIWQGQELRRGVSSIKDRAERVRKLIESEISRRNAHKEFEKLLATRSQDEKDEIV